MTYYDDIGDSYEWAVQLPVQAISLDFLGVPGSALGNETAALIEKHGFPSDKRLGAGVVDGRSVFADGEYPSKLIAALQAKVGHPCGQSKPCILLLHLHPPCPQLHITFRLAALVECMVGEALSKY